MTYRILVGNIVFFVCFLHQLTQAQTKTDPQWGSWQILTIQKSGTPQRPLGGFLEVQSRMNGVFRQFQYYEYKGGITRDIGPNFTLLLGGGRYVTYDYQDLGKGPLLEEWRMWEQLNINQFLSRLKFEHRYRIEQRWINDQYRNRFRYRLNLSIPINKPKIEAKTVFASVYNEIFLNNRVPHFERNRFYVGFGYQFNQQIVVQAGWINQYNYTPTGSNAKNNFLLSCQYRLPSKGKSEKVPSFQD
jgi:hypothetical protein